MPSGSPVKLMNNGEVSDVLTCTSPVVLNKNNEIVSIAMLSVAVMFVGMNVCERNDAFGGVGSTNCIAGGVMSLTVKLVVSVLLMFPDVSFAMMVTLYNPGMSVSSGVKVKLKMFPARLVMVNILLVAFGTVMFVSTVSTCMLSVMLTVMLVLCVWLILFLFNILSIRLLTSILMLPFPFGY